MSGLAKGPKDIDRLKFVKEMIAKLGSAKGKEKKGIYSMIISNAYEYYKADPKTYNIMQGEIAASGDKPLIAFTDTFAHPEKYTVTDKSGVITVTYQKKMGKKGFKQETVPNPSSAHYGYYNQYMIDDSYDDDDMYSQQSLSYGPSYGHDHYVDSHYYGQEYGYQPKYLYDNNSQNYSLAMIVPAILIGLCLLSIIACICCIIGGGIGYGVTKLSNNNKGKGKDYYQRVPRDKDYEQEV